jgi:hypothetical protein
MPHILEKMNLIRLHCRGRVECFRAYIFRHGDGFCDVVMLTNRSACCKVLHSELPSSVIEPQISSQPLPGQIAYSGTDFPIVVTGLVSSSMLCEARITKQKQ